MSEEQIMLKLEMYLVYFCQNNCIEHTCLRAINIIFPKFACLCKVEVLKLLTVLKQRHFYIVLNINIYYKTKAHNGIKLDKNLIKTKNI